MWAAGWGWFEITIWNVSRGVLNDISDDMEGGGGGLITSTQTWKIV